MINDQSRLAGKLSGTTRYPEILARSISSKALRGLNLITKRDVIHMDFNQILFCDFWMRGSCKHL